MPREDGAKVNVNAPRRLRPGHHVGEVHIPKLREAPTFRPTEEEFGDFAGYVAQIAAEASSFGICKVVPPASWRGPPKDAPSDTFTLRSAIRQHVSGTHGVYTMIHQEAGTKSTYQRFARQAKSYAQREFATDGTSVEALDALEAKFWTEIGTRSEASAPLYGADLDGSFFSPETTQWNLNSLPDLLRTGRAKLTQQMSGINTPMLYFGGFRTAFCMHTEDMDLVYTRSGKTPQKHARAPRPSVACMLT